MNISRIVLFNFDGVEGIGAFNFSKGLNRFSGQSAIINGIRFVLDRNYTYDNKSRKPAQYVQLVIKSLEQDLSLTLTRTVQKPDHVDIDGKAVPLKTFYKDLAKTIVCFDTEFVEATKQFTDKSFLGFLSNPNQVHTELTRSVRETFIADLRETRLEFEELKDVVTRRVDFYNQIQERNNRIKHCQIVHKCYQRKIQESLTRNAEETGKAVELLSQNCTEIHSGLHELIVDMINEKKVINASVEIPINEFYFVDRKFASTFEGVADTLRQDYDQVTTLMTQIVAQQRQDLFDVLQMENPPTTSKSFQLELNRQLSKLPANNLEALNAEKRRLNQMYNSCYKDAKVEQNLIEGELSTGEEFLQDFKNGINFLLDEQIIPALVDFELSCSILRESVEKANLNKVSEINFRSVLTEIKQVLDYDDAILEGLSSLLRLLHNDEYVDVAASQYLGPIFQIMDFREHVDIGMKTYFQSQLKPWYPVVVVRTVAFAQRIMLDFNRLNLKGTITIISCDNYRQKTNALAKSGVALTEVIIDGDKHPLRNLFSTIVYNEEADLLSGEGDCIEDPLTGGLTMQSNELRVPSVQLENILKSYYETEFELIRLENNSIDIPQLRTDLLRHWNQIEDKVYEIIFRKRNFISFIEAQKELQIKIEAFAKSKEAILNKIDLNQKINQQLIQMITNGEVKADNKYYERKIEELVKTLDDSVRKVATAGRKYDPRKVENLLDELRYLSVQQDDSVELITHPLDLVIKTPCYAHIEIPHSSSIPQLIHQAKEYKQELREAYRLYLKYKRMEHTTKMMGSELGALLDSSHNLNLRANNRKSISELASELRQLDVDYNVNPYSKLYSAKVISRVKQILKNYSEIMTKEADLKDCEENLHAILLYRAQTPEFQRIATIWSHIQFFYENCRTHPITNVELICKVNPNKSASQLAMRDLCGADVAFITPFGILRAEDLGPSNFQVFCIVLAFANMMYNQIKVLTIRQFDQIDAETMTEILSFLEANDIQIILETKGPSATSSFAMDLSNYTV